MSQSLIAPAELAQMETGTLANWLIERARDARAMLLSEDLGTLKDLLTTLSAASALATGQQRDLLEVAEAFVKPLGGKLLGRREIAIREFLKTQPGQGDTFLNSLLDRGGVSRSAFERFP